MPERDAMLRELTREDIRRLSALPVVRAARTEFQNRLEHPILYSRGEEVDMFSQAFYAAVNAVITETEAERLDAVDEQMHIRFASDIEEIVSKQLFLSGMDDDAHRDQIISASYHIAAEVIGLMSDEVIRAAAIPGGDG